MNELEAVEYRLSTRLDRLERLLLHIEFLLDGIIGVLGVRTEQRHVGQDEASSGNE